MHAVLSIGGAVAGLIGLLWSVWGTYLLTKSYHPFTKQAFSDFIQEAPYLAMVLLKLPSQRSNQEKGKLELLERAAVAARANDENRAISLLGIGLIFIGFLFQTLSAALITADTLWSRPWSGP